MRLTFPDHFFEMTKHQQEEFITEQMNKFYDMGDYLKRLNVSVRKKKFNNQKEISIDHEQKIPKVS